MAIANIIASGIGFNPGSIKFIPTRGFGAAPEVEDERIAANRFWRRKMRKKQKIREEEETIMQMIKEFLEEHG